MPQFDLSAAPSGLAAGRQIPNRNTGLADVIKSITNDLRAAASSRQEQALKLQEERTKRRGQNLDTAKALLTTGKFRIKPGADIGDFIENGTNLDAFEAPPSEAEQLKNLKSLFGGAGGMEAFPQGTTMKFGNFNIPLNPPQTPERANTISALETMGSLLNDMNALLTENPKRVATGNIPGVNFFDRQANAIFRLYDKTAAIAAGGKQLTTTELALIASNRPTIADVMDPKAMQYKMTKLKQVLIAAHNRLTRGLSGEVQMDDTGNTLNQVGGAGDLLNKSGGYAVGEIITGADGNQYRIIGGDPSDPDIEPVGGAQ